MPTKMWELMRMDRMGMTWAKERGYVNRRALRSLLVDVSFDLSGPSLSIDVNSNEDGSVSISISVDLGSSGSLDFDVDIAGVDFSGGEISTGGGPGGWHP